MTEGTKIAKSEISAGSCKTITVGEREIVVYNVDGEFFATSNICVHQGGPLGDGLLDGATIVCPWHAWPFDVRTGESLFDPGRKLDCFRVTVEGDDVVIEV